MWIDTKDKEQLPPAGKPVLAFYKSKICDVARTIRAYWLPDKFSEADEPYDYCIYDKERECYYDPEGWYEAMDHCEEFSGMFIIPENVEITHWQYLPEDPLEYQSADTKSNGPTENTLKKNEPVAYIYKTDPTYDGNQWHDKYEVTTSKRLAFWKDPNAKPLCYCNANQS